MDSEQRWAGAGWSSCPDSAKAATESVRTAVDGRPADLVIVFFAEQLDAEQIVKAVHQAAPGAQVVGCSTAGEITPGPVGDVGVCALALGGGFEVRTAVATDASLDMRQAGVDVVAGTLTHARGPYSVTMLLSDGLAGDQHEVVRGAYSVAGAQVALVGGFAGDGLRMQRTVQVHGARVYTDAVVAVTLSCDAPFGIGVSHGWTPLETPVVLTATEGNRVSLLDDAPALDVYLTRLQAPAETWTDRAAFTRFALHHPLGLERRDGVSVRFVADADFATRELICVTSLPSGSLAHVMGGDRGSVLDSVDAACAQALGQLGGRDPLALLAFDCIGRRGVLGDDGLVEEVDRMTSAAGGSPVIGFYTYGEIARTVGSSGFHNQTLVVLALS